MSLKTLTQKAIDSNISKTPYSLRPSSIDRLNNLYYVNGLLKNTDKASKALKEVNSYFPYGPFQLIHNDNNYLKDFPEIQLDYEWLKIAGQAQQMKTPITNPAIYKTLAILEIGKKGNFPLGLIGSSQGSLVIFNALLAFYSLSQENKNYLKNQIRACLVGSLVPSRFYALGHTMIEKFIACVYKGDYLASAFTQEKAFPSLHRMGKHAIKWYLPNSETVKKHFRKKTNLDEDEPFVKKDFFQIVDSTNDTGITLLDKVRIANSQKWLQPFLATNMQ